MTRQKREIGFGEAIETMKEERRNKSTSVKHYAFWIIITLVSGYIGHLVYGVGAYL